MEVDEGTLSNAAAQPKGGDDKAGGKLHVLGIGGRRAKRGSAKTTGTKKTPGEIRIQKGEGCGTDRSAVSSTPSIYLPVYIHQNSTFFNPVVYTLKL